MPGKIQIPHSKTNHWRIFRGMENCQIHEVWAEGTIYSLYRPTTVSTCGRLWHSHFIEEDWSSTKIKLHELTFEPQNLHRQLCVDFLSPWRIQLSGFLFQLSPLSRCLNLQTHQKHTMTRVVINHLVWWPSLPHPQSIPPFWNWTHTSYQGHSN